jgi:hypothetical protein
MKMKPTSRGHNKSLLSPCCSFLGPLDSKAGPTYDKRAFWPNVTVFDATNVEAFFESFEIRRFREHNTSGSTPQGNPHEWRILSVVAQESNH